jgi:hypothetical protein
VTTRLRVAVASDIHADANIDEPRDSYVRTEPPRRQAFSNPLRDLIRFVDRERITADILLCPGDMTNRSDNTGKLYAWMALNELADALQADALYATPGNHDLETHSPVPDPTAALRTLSPSYPTRDAARDDLFWRDGYCVVEDPVSRFVILNSCLGFPSHPGAAADEVEINEYKVALDRGAFLESTQIALENDFSSWPHKPVNVLMTHHHVAEHEKRHLFKDTYGPMGRGDELLGLLDRYPGTGRWLVVHGHKHVPLIANASGGSASTPIVMSAASVGGKLWHPIVSVTRNQFHILEFHVETVLGLPDLRGVCESYMWGFGDGWGIAANTQAGLPAMCGFGVSHDHRDLARRVASLLSPADEIVKWDLVVEHVPEITYQSHRDLLLLDDALADLGFVVVPDRRGRRRQLVRTDDDD